MARLNSVRLALLFVVVFTLCGCQGLVPKDPMSILFHGFRRSEIIGFLAGLGTTFAALPDLLAMLKRRSSVGMNPRMSAITGLFQIGWVYYGLLIDSRPVVIWNVLGVLINSFSVSAYFYFTRQEKTT